MGLPVPFFAGWLAVPSFGLQASTAGSCDGLQHGLLHQHACWQYDILCYFGACFASCLMAPLLLVACVALELILKRVTDSGHNGR